MLPDESLPAAPQRDFAYDAFASYATDPDAAVVRDVERFLESIHANPLIPQNYRAKLELCVDGSDFKLAGRQRGQPPAPIREIIIGYMRQCRCFVLFAGPKSAAHEWVNFEIEWWLENRGAESVLLAVTHSGETESLFPKCVLDEGLHQSLWFDLRGYGGGAAQTTRRGYQEERLRLAAALLEVAPAQLLTGWREEAARARRRRAIIRAVLTTAIVALLVVAGYALRRWRENARQARASEWALLSEQIAAPQANRALDRLAYALASFREHQTAHSYAALQQAMAPLPVAVGAFRVTPGRGIQAIRFLENDRLLLTIGHDGVAQFTSTATRRAVNRLPLSGRAYDIAVHPSGPLLAVATSRGVDLVEYSMTAARIIAHAAAEAPVRAVAFDPAGLILYTGDFDGAVTQYTVPAGAAQTLSAGRRLVVLDHIGAPVGIVGFAPAWQAKRMAIVGIQGDFCTLDLAAWSVRCADQRGEQVHALAMAPQAGVAAAAEARGGVRVFRASSGETIASIKAPPADSKQVTTGIALSSDGERVGVTEHDGTVRVYSTADQRPLNVVVGDIAARSVAFSESGTLLAAGSDGGDVTLCQIGGNTDAWSASGILAAAVDSTARRVVSLTKDALQIRDVQSGRVLAVIPVADVPRSVAHFALTRDGKAVAARFDRSDRVVVWRIDGGSSGPKILQHANEVSHVAVVSSIVPGPGRSQLVTTESFQSRAASLWDVDGPRLLVRIPMEEQVFLAAVGKDTIAIADRSGVVRLTSAARAAVTAAFRVRGTPSLLALDPEDRTLFIAWSTGRASRACLYDLGAPLACRSVTLEGMPVGALFSPSGRFLAIATEGGVRGGRVVVVDRDQQWAARPLDSTSLVHHLAFSADESTLAAGHDQRGVSIFSTRDGAQLAEVAVGAQLKAVALVPDAAQTLVTLTDTGSLQAWRWKPADVVQAACSRWPAAYRPTAVPGTPPIPPRDELCGHIDG